MNIGGIFSKIESKADWVAYILEAWEAIPSLGPGTFTGISGMIQYYLSPNGAINEIKNTFSWPGLIEEKLASNHIYAKGLKYGAAFWILQELGILTQYRATTEKVIKASALALITLPGSGPYRANASTGRRHETLPTANPSSITSQNAGAY
jgi:hypothetical protein